LAPPPASRPSARHEPENLDGEERMKRRPDTEAGPWIARFLRGHVRLWISLAIGLVAYWLAPVNLPFAIRFLIGWDVGVIYYLAVTVVVMTRSTPNEIRYHSALHDEGALAMLLLAVAATLVSLGAIFVELAGIKQSQIGYGFDVALAVATVVLSWMFIHTIFALHYAHDFYGIGRRARGLKFPGDDKPDYWDFVYFAFVIGMTFQVSDVGITNKWIRRTVVGHGGLSFVFTATILALAVNIAASLIGLK
jgi:uncharacterized membrane protein